MGSAPSKNFVPIRAMSNIGDLNEEVSFHQISPGGGNDPKLAIDHSTKSQLLPSPEGQFLMSAEGSRVRESCYLHRRVSANLIADDLIGLGVTSKRLYGSSGDLLGQRKPSDEAVEQREVPGERQLAARLGI